MADAPPPMEERLFRLLQHRASMLDRGDPLGLPIYQTSAFHLPDDPEEGDYTYTRDGNPTWTGVEAQLSILEDATAIGFPSGMAAIAAVLYTQLRPGDMVVLPSDGYYGVRAFASSAIAPLGIRVVEWPTEDFRNAPVDGAKLVWIETPSNPGLDVCDIREIVAKAHAAGALVGCDNTTLTPLLQQPLDLGVDVVAVSDTKAMSGHGDVLFGHLASRNDDIMSSVQQWRKVSGAIPGPAEAALVHRGLETLEVRLERMCTNASVIAEHLAGHAAVDNVRYPGLGSDPSHAIMQHQANGFGFVIGFTLPSKSDAEQFLAECNGIYSATSFGSVHTSAERRARWGEDVPDGFIRLSVGCEPVEELLREIDRTLRAL